MNVLKYSLNMEEHATWWNGLTVFPQLAACNRAGDGDSTLCFSETLVPNTHESTRHHNTLSEGVSEQGAEYNIWIEGGTDRFEETA